MEMANRASQHTPLLTVALRSPLIAATQLSCVYLLCTCAIEVKGDLRVKHVARAGRSVEIADQYLDARYSLGFMIYFPGGEDDSKFRDVIPGTPAGQAGIPAGAKLLAVNGRRWSAEILREAIRAAKNSSQPIELLVDNDDFLKTYRLDYHGGERYPHLERDPAAPDLLSDIAKCRAPAVTH